MGSETPNPEIWKDISGYPDYQVSSLGRVMRKAGFNTIGRRVEQKVLRQRGRPYRKVNLSNGGRKTTHNVAQLVAAAFLGPANGLTVNHKDCDKLNNHVGNLEYLTMRENTMHAAANGRMMVKLDPTKIREIRTLSDSGVFQRTIAERFGVVRSVISDIVRGHRWSWVGRTD